MVADLEVNLVRAALDGIADYEKLMAIEPARHEFDDEGAARAMSFVGEYVRQYGSLPSVDAVRETARVELPDKTGMVFDHWLGEFVERRVFRMTNRAIQQAYSLLEQNKGHEAFASMKAFVDEGLGRTVVKPPSTIFSHGRKVVERLREGRAGMVGIETPWPTLTSAMNGYQPGTMTMFVARPGTGKTFVMVCQMLHTWKEGKRVLAVSPEMSNDELAERTFVVDTEIAYGRVVRGEVGALELKKVEARVDELREMDGIWAIDEEDACSPAYVESSIRLTQPHLVLIDAAYMLDFFGRDDKARMDAMLAWGRKLAKRENVALVIFHQLSRGATKDEKKGGGSNMDNIALTDRAGWDCHNIFALEQDADMKADRRMRIKKIKIRREAFTFRDLLCNWDFNKHDISEVKSSEVPVKSGFEDTGAPSGDPLADLPF